MTTMMTNHPTVGRMIRMAKGKFSVTLPAELAEAAKAKAGTSGLSAYITKALERQVAQDNLVELVTDLERIHGPVNEDALADKWERLNKALRDETPEP